MNWLMLIFAGLLEVVWAVGLKYTEGFTKLLPSLITITAMLGSFYFLSLAMRSLPLTIAYPVWVGIGMVFTVLFGFLFFKEPVSPVKLFSLVLIVTGIAGLKLS